LTGLLRQVTASMTAGGNERGSTGLLRQATALMAAVGGSMTAVSYSVTAD
jgi:hypothetical protein